jgi:S-methylmethionine-dependent homocysteine/selenocysteine methylase
MAILLDGAIGTEIEKRGLPVNLPLWSAHALLMDPNCVFQIHLSYVEAGVDVLTTNTFRTQRRTLAKVGMEGHTERINHLAVSLAVEAAKVVAKKVMVAGSLAPLEDCYRPDLSPRDGVEEFRELTDIFAEYGCDLILIETMNNVAEARSALVASQKSGLPYWLSVTPSNRDPLRLLSGESIDEIIKIAAGEGAGALLVNCASMANIETSVSYLNKKIMLPFGGYANNGIPDEVLGWRFDHELQSTEFSNHIKKLLSLGANIVGGCCGIGPVHIKSARSVIDDLTCVG